MVPCLVFWVVVNAVVVGAATVVRWDAGILCLCCASTTNHAYFNLDMKIVNDRQPALVKIHRPSIWQTLWNKLPLMCDTP